MNVFESRNNNVLILRIEGRLDAFGAKKMEEIISGIIKENDKNLILDFSKLSYLSSGGIRILVALHKKLSQKSGALLLCNLQMFSLNALQMAGFDKFFRIYSSLEEAESVISGKNEPAGDSNKKGLYSNESDNLYFDFYSMTNRKPFLKVVGDISKVLYSSIEDKDMFSRRFSETEYSIGLGALGSEIKEGAELFGEMITIGGAMVWLPTDGNDTPDFLIPAKDTGQITIYTGFNVALNGPFNDIFFIASKNSSGISLAEIYSFIFEFAKKNRGFFKGIASVAMISELSGLYSSGLKKSPLKKNKPANNEMVMHKDNIAEWVDLNNDPKFENEIMISFGIGVDLTSDLSGLNQDLLNSMSYT
nr:STAS domain-containing protein [bacterium]